MCFYNFEYNNNYLIFSNLDKGCAWSLVIGKDLLVHVFVKKIKSYTTNMILSNKHDEMPFFLMNELNYQYHFLNY
jgi:hypothetical protein